MGDRAATPATAPVIRGRTPTSSAAVLRRMFATRAGWGWDDRFHAAVVEELASLVSESQRMRNVDRILAHLRSVQGRATTHPEIARAVGVPRETVTRALIALRKAGRVRSFALRSDRGAAGARRLYTVLG